MSDEAQREWPRLRPDGYTLYLFDVDETMEFSGGPVRVAELVKLREAGHLVGVCGNWSLLASSWPWWFRVVSIMGPMGSDKPAMLTQLKSYLTAPARFVLVGNKAGGASPDDEAIAKEGGFEFIAEHDFAEGKR